ncbi:MAG: hypothetical protein ABSE07_08890 [Methanoregula sp.]|jgi:hypothetical protein
MENLVVSPDFLEFPVNILVMVENHSQHIMLKVSHAASVAVIMFSSFEKS